MQAFTKPFECVGIRFETGDSFVSGSVSEFRVCSQFNSTVFVVACIVTPVSKLGRIGVNGLLVALVLPFEWNQRLFETGYFSVFDINSEFRRFPLFRATFAPYVDAGGSAQCHIAYESRQCGHRKVGEDITGRGHFGLWRASPPCYISSRSSIHRKCDSGQSIDVQVFYWPCVKQVPSLSCALGRLH